MIPPSRRGSAGPVAVECPVCELRQLPPDDGSCRKCGARLLGRTAVARHIGARGDSVPLDIGLGNEDDLTGPATVPSGVSEVSLPSVVCGGCGLQQLRGESGRCPKCGKSRPASSHRASHSTTQAVGGRRSGIAAPPPGRPGAPPPDSVAIGALELAIERAEGDVLNAPAAAPWEKDAAEHRRAAPYHRPPRPHPLVRAFRALRRFVWKIPSPRRIPRWARWEMVIGPLLGLLVLLAFHVQTVQPVSLSHHAERLGLHLTLPESGWYREPVGVRDGQAATYRFGLTAAGAPALIWIRTLPLGVGHAYAAVGPAGGVAAPPAEGALSPEALQLDSSNLLLGAREAAALDIEVGAPRGCHHTSAGGAPALRCRYGGALDGTPFDLDLYAFGSNTQLVLALVAVRAGEEYGALREATHGIVSTITLTP